MRLDRYATHHCPVIEYDGDSETFYPSVAACAAALGVSVRRVKRWLHSPYPADNGRDYDIPADVPWVAVEELTSQGKKRIRLISVFQKR